MQSAVMRRRSAGFTLIEVVLAVGILAIMLSIGYGALRNIIRSKEILDDGRDARSVADAVLLRMVRELQLGYDRDLALIPDCNNPNAPANPVGDDFEGDMSSGGKTRTDSITFLALEGGQYLPDGGGHSGVVQIRYYMAPTPADTPGDSGPYSLIREEIPHIKPYSKACQQAMIFPITSRITSLQFSYYDSKNSVWVDSWTYPDHSHVPALIKFSITLTSAAGRPTTFTTTVPVHQQPQ